MEIRERPEPRAHKAQQVLQALVQRGQQVPPGYKEIPDLQVRLALQALAELMEVQVQRERVEERQALPDQPE
jgi:hypothetical protein